MGEAKKASSHFKNLQNEIGNREQKKIIIFLDKNKLPISILYIIYSLLKSNYLQKNRIIYEIYTNDLSKLEIKIIKRYKDHFRIVNNLPTLNKIKNNELYFLSYINYEKRN